MDPDVSRRHFVLVAAEVHEVAVHIGDPNMVELGAVDTLEVEPGLVRQLGDVRVLADATVRVRALDRQVAEHDLGAVA